ncbi:MAG: (Fe-S)-binding protein [Acidobacteriota bacterium]
MARAVTSCVHCGFCLASCPTYQVLGEEMDSPRGRIVLMKQVLEGVLTVGDAHPFVERCLGCLACETACPSGVRYRELVVPFRAYSRGAEQTLGFRTRRQALLTALESPPLFRLACAWGLWARRLTRWLPSSLRPLVSLLPRTLPPRVRLPEHSPAVGRRRARVALLAGCAQQVLRPSINVATIRVLTAAGIEVVVPDSQNCCGALALHVGETKRADALAARNGRVLPSDVDAIVTTSAGCGSAMKESSYPAPVKDVSEFLHEVGMPDRLRLPAPTRIGYHDACHLSHGQGVRLAPRRLLSQIEGVTLVELSPVDVCCGSAGLYNLEHVETAGELGRRRADAARRAGADLVVAGNIGCLQQLDLYLASDARPIPTLHTIEVLDSAYSFVESPGRARIDARPSA